MDRTARLGRAMIAQLPALRRYALGLSGNTSAADDLVQDCLEHALRHLGSLQGEEKFAGWLRSILFNVFVDGRRRMKHQGESVELAAMDNTVGEVAPQARRHEADEVLRATLLLGEQHRQVLLLVGVEGLSYRDAAEELGVPIGTVMSRLARARDQLRALLEGGVPAPTTLPFRRRP